MTSIQDAFNDEWDKKSSTDISKGFYFQIENVFSFSDEQLKELYQALQTTHQNKFKNIIGSNRTFAEIVIYYDNY